MQHRTKGRGILPSIVSAKWGQKGLEVREATHPPLKIEGKQPNTWT
jgi:hypothetical protein